MNIYTVLIVVVTMMLATNSASGQPPSIFGKYRSELELKPVTTANIIEQLESPHRKVVPQKLKSGKSSGVALVLSALVPGAGQLYAGAKTKAAVFFGLEAATLGLYLNWRSEGDDIEAKFRQRADEQWSPIDYLAWRVSPISSNSSFTHALPCSSYVDEYQRTGNFVGCDDKEVQQYYELIGKYDQFIPGWNDVVEARTGNAVLPTRIDSVENYRSENRFSYEDRRNDSNKLLKRASNLTGLLLINHALSAIDAARVARKIQGGADMEQVERRTRVSFSLYPWEGEQIPMLVAYKPIE